MDLRFRNRDMELIRDSSFRFLGDTSWRGRLEIAHGSSTMHDVSYSNNRPDSPVIGNARKEA